MIIKEESLLHGEELDKDNDLDGCTFEVDGCK